MSLRFILLFEITLLNSMTTCVSKITVFFRSTSDKYQLVGFRTQWQNIWQIPSDIDLSKKQNKQFWNQIDQIYPKISQEKFWPSSSFAKLLLWRWLLLKCFGLCHNLSRIASRWCMTIVKKRKTLMKLLQTIFSSDYRHSKCRTAENGSRRQTSAFHEVLCETVNRNFHKKKKIFPSAITH